MLESDHGVGIVGLARDDESGQVQDVLWAAVEDAGVVLPRTGELLVFAPAELAGVRAISGLRVQDCAAEEAVTSAAAHVAAGPDRVAVAYDAQSRTAVVFTTSQARYGLLTDRPLAEIEPRQRTGTASAQSTAPLLVSGRSEAGLRAHAARLSQWLKDNPEAALADVAFTLLTERTVWERSVVVSGSDRDQVVHALDVLAAGGRHDHLDREVPSQRADVVFTFPGHGSHWLGMGRALAETNEVFREALADCARALRPHVDYELDDVLSGAVPMDRVEVVHPVLFAIMVSLARLWLAHGVRPAAVIGQSIGEIAAATVAGCFSLDEGTRLIVELSKSLALIEGQGAMLAVSLPAAEAIELAGQWGLDLAVALVNGPRSTVLSGAPAAVAEFLAGASRQGIRARQIDIEVAAHSPQIEPLREHMLRALRSIVPRPGQLPVYAAAVGGLLDTMDMDAAYWHRSMRETARFQQAAESAIEQGHRLFVEMSPHPVLTMAVEDTAAGVAVDVDVLEGLRRDDAGFDRHLRSLTRAHVHGATPDWHAVFEGASGISLPAYRLSADTGEHDLRAVLSALPEQQRLARVLDLLLDLLVAQRGPEITAEVRRGGDFRSLGVDSVGALGLRNQLNEATGLCLPATAVFDHPTPQALAEEVLRGLYGREQVLADEQVANGHPDEPIAIVGMACRLPGGVTSPEQLWELVASGRDAVAEFPADRGWDVESLYSPDAFEPGTFYQREAGLLHGIDRFDARFFGISPREAVAMDPQQRLLLETSWEALERAGLDAATLRGSRTGVFTGAMTLPYGSPLHQARPELEGYVLTGTTGSVTSGRLSYLLGLEGPAITVDTACSSSLVALHLACQSLRLGECDLAFAGGATVLAEPGMFIEFSRQRALAPDGRSKAFSADADGFGMSEGVGVLLVERLSDARRLGHPVLAVVRGSAINQDGASNGLTAPSGPAQQRVIRAALAAARVRAADVDVVEAHGTGTRLGDPIEAQAIIATYGRARGADSPLWIGSLKSNLGHAQAAAGVAGVIKMVMAMRHGVLPRSLHAERPTTEVDWSAGTVRLLDQPREWLTGEHPRRAGVSSFGISGTNAHVILEQHDGPTEHGMSPASGPVPLVLSARTANAVAGQAVALRQQLAEYPEIALSDTAWSLVSTRSAHEYRAVVVAEDTEEASELLAEVTAGTSGAGRVAAVFSGQGAQRPGMGRELAERFPAFAHALDEVCELADPELGCSLKDLMWTESAETLARTEFAQPALFAFELAMARLWQSWGVRFTAVAGHSVGEIAAAVVAGVLSVADATRLVVARGRLMQDLPPGGAMVAIAAGEPEVATSLAGESEVAIAAVNGPQAVVVSGAESAVLRVEEHWRQAGHRTTRLHVSHAFHSPLMEPVLDAFAAAIADIVPAEAELAVSPAANSEHAFGTVGYWLDHARYEVRFADAVAALPETDLVVELGPDAALVPLLDNGVPTARRDRPETSTVLTAVGRAHACGATVEWTTVLSEGNRVDLPTYAFDRESFWQSALPAAASGFDGIDHPLLTSVVELPEPGGVLLTGRLSTTAHPWLADHVVDGSVLFPGTGFVEFGLCAARRFGAARLGELVVRAPLVLSAAVDVQVWATPVGEGAHDLVIRGRGADGVWTVHATGKITSDRTAPRPSQGQWPPAGTNPLPLKDFYELLSARGYTYGPAFQGLISAWRRGEEVFAEVELPAEQRDERFVIHPALLDAALHTLLLDGDGVVLPFAFTGVDLPEQAAPVVRVRVSAGPRLDLLTADGTPVMSVDSVVMRAPAPATGESLYEFTPVPADLAEPVEWAEHCAPGTGPRPPFVLLRPDFTATGDLAADTHAVTREVLGVVRQWLADDQAADSRLVVCAGDDPVGAAVGGLVRAVVAEHPQRFGLLDLDDTAASAEALSRALPLLADEPQLRIRDGEVSVLRLTRADAGLTPLDEPWRLDVVDGELALVPSADATRVLEPGEVRIAVRAAGLNFRDVLIRLGAYPGSAIMGSEAAGVVVEVGAEVTDLCVGERVTGVLTGGFGPVAVADRRKVTTIPPGWSFAEAAAVPLTFLTAYYGLAELAGLRPGQSVLVHSAAGGVGTAAVQIAQHLGAEVFATASPGKWAALRALGLDEDHIASSRDLGFAERFGPVDVVLNSLAREFVDASLGLLRPGGRFVEMGKTDLREAADLPGIDYLPFDLYEVEPDLIASMTSRVLALFRSGELRLPPIRAWDLRQAQAAFRHVEQAAHVGKVVLTVPAALDLSGTVVITGGTGGLGSELARHLVTRHGVRNLVLLSRGGDGSAVADLDATVDVVSCDVTDREQLSAALRAIPADRPLTAVVHAAGVVDDALVESLTGDRLDAVLGVKVDATVLLDELTRDLDVASFVLFSSVSAALGVPGQAAYGAANAFLDAYAVRRASQGRPITALAWGLWEHRTGITAGLGQDDIDRWARRGLAPLSLDRGLHLYDRAGEFGQAGLAPIELNRSALRGQDTVPAAMRALARPTAPTARPATRGGFAARAAELRPEALLTELVRLVRADAASVQGRADATAIEPAKAFKDAGFDSMTSLELRQRLESDTGLSLPASVVFDYPNPRALAEYLAGRITGTARAERAVLPARVVAEDDLVAIVGMGCRFPGGVDTPEQLWRLVANGVDAVTPFPADRGWDLDALGAGSAAQSGGFLADAGGFDAEFFGITPREALAMDPQQRLLLETSWEALERSGIDPAGLRGSRTGVFVGAIAQEYGPRLYESTGAADGHALTGTTNSVTSGRVSYALGLEGPAVTVDTACSSSLVALHLAARSLRHGETDLALVGGATVMASPGMFVEFSRQGGLASDGRCKAFSAEADGTGWAEGVGVLVVERLSDARRAGHRVLAVVRGSAVNQDGASNGLTAPNGPSQQQVIRAALADAGLTAAEVDLVEAHGTGTRLGDPIEAQALIATYGQEHTPEHPLWLGSLKSNIGHAQAAAGVGGVIKVVLAMRHGLMPRTLHADTPTTEVDWSGHTVELLAAQRQWPAVDAPRRAAVSSFGISGTNAHVILEDCPAGPGEPAEDEVVPVVLSGKSAAAVTDQAAALREHLAEGGSTRDLAWTLATTRSRFDHRTVLVGDRQQVIDKLASPAVVRAGAGRVGAVFTGQGAQRAGMGHELAERFPVFAAALDEVCALIDPLLGRSLKDLMWSGPDEVLSRTEFAQPALFAFEIALARLWQSCGVSFSVLAGHSVGEVAVAVLTGVLSAADAAKLVVARSRLMQRLPAGGAMMAVEATESEVSDALADQPGAVIAAINGPHAIVISGEAEAVERIGSVLRAQGSRTNRLNVSHAFHSPLMEPMLAEFADLLAELSFHEPVIEVSPAAAANAPFWTPAYWVEHVWRAVRFAEATAAMSTVDVVIEVGPDAALTPHVDADVVVASTRRDRPEVPEVLRALGKAHAHGVPVDWTAVLVAGSSVELPTYAFQRSRYWLVPPVPTGSGAGADTLAHPMLTGRTDLPGAGGVLLTGRLAPQTDPWLRDHAVMGTVLLPGTGFVELAVAAAREVGAECVGELVLQAPLVFPGGHARDVQVWVAPGDRGERELHIRSRSEAGEWVLHATGTLIQAGGPAPFTADWATASWPPAGARQAAVEALYPDLADRGYEYGPVFQGTNAVWLRGEEIFAEIALPEGQPTGFGSHPALLDAALHALPFTGRSYEGQEVRLPFSFSGVRLHSADPTQLRVRLTVAGDSVTVQATDGAGVPVIAVDSLILRPVDRAQLEQAGATGKARRLAVDWEQVPGSTEARQVAGTWLLVGESRPELDLLFERTTRTVTEPGTVTGVVVFGARADQVLTDLAAAPGDAPIWCVTTGAVVVGVEDPAVDVAAAGVWGLGRVAALELPERWRGLVDLPERIDTRTAGLLAGLLSGDGAEDQVAIRAGGLWARRVVEALPVSTEVWAPEGTVLITGGTGALGGHLARRLAARGGCRLVLVSRRGEQAPGAAELLTDLGSVEVEVVAADTADRIAMAELVARLDAQGHPVRAVVHTAGEVRDARILDTTADALRAEMAGKVTGALVLDELLPDLDAFVLYSSIAGIWGAAGQAGYAAGNACLDALAQRRRARGQAATALAWGPWSGGGMVDPEIERELRRRGLTPLSVPAAMRALEQTLTSGTDSVVVDVDWAKFLPAFTAVRQSRLLHRFAPAATTRPAAPAAGGGAPLGQRLAGMPEAERSVVLLDVVRATVAEVIGRSDPDRIDPDRALKDIGFDSLMSVELRNRLSEAVGAKLPATLVFNHPTPNALSTYLRAEVVVDQTAAPETPVLAEVDRIEARALSAFTDQATRVALATRLGALLDRLAELDAKPVTTASLDNASADELMRFIDTELGDL
jgi:acyl transferase domain-containing protein/D-arabinose 1-dehydrogenase-like Zn-dependent alcohol dehydrogenase